MESSPELERLISSLALQIELGVDEWVADRPINRFLAPQTQHPPAPRPEKSNGAAPKADPNLAEADPTALMTKAGDYTSIYQAALAALPKAVAEHFANEVMIAPVGDPKSEFLLVVDAPSREAHDAGDLRADPANRLLEKSLTAIGLVLDPLIGARAQLQMVPIAPWRLPQGRRMTEAEAKIFQAALAQLIAISDYRAILFAGGDLAGLAPDIDGRFADHPAFALVSPRAMLREPLLKRRHWQGLLALHNQLDEILKL